MGGKDDKQQDSISPVETSYDVEGGVSMEVSGEEADVKFTGGEGGSVEITKDSVDAENGSEETTKDNAEEVSEAPEADAEEKTEEESTDSDLSAEDLGEYKKEDAEKWAKAYTKEGGLLNTERLSTEWWANKKGEEPGKLYDGTYEYLQQEVGLSRTDVDAIGAALELQAKSLRAGLEERAGGPEAFAAALEWAKGAGGYSESQMARFNKAMVSRDMEVMQEAVDLLSARYTKANPANPPPGPKPKPKEARGSAVPKSDASAVAKYATMEEQLAEGRRVRNIKDPVAQQKAAERHFMRMR